VSIQLEMILELPHVELSGAAQTEIICVPGAMEPQDKENGNNTPPVGS
jgi:hypothetical protein